MERVYSSGMSDATCSTCQNTRLSPDTSRPCSAESLSSWSLSPASQSYRSNKSNINKKKKEKKWTGSLERKRQKKQTNKQAKKVDGFIRMKKTTTTTTTKNRRKSGRVHSGFGGPSAILLQRISQQHPFFLRCLVMYATTPKIRVLVLLP